MTGYEKLTGYKEYREKRNDARKKAIENSNMLAWWKDQLPIETIKWIDQNAAEIAQSVLDEHGESLRSLETIERVRLKNRLEPALRRYLSRICETKEEAKEGIVQYEVQQPIVDLAFDTAEAKLSEFPELAAHEFDADGYEAFTADQNEAIDDVNNSETGPVGGVEEEPEEPEKPATNPSPWKRHRKPGDDRKRTSPWKSHSKPGDDRNRTSPWTKQEKGAKEGNADDEEDEEDDDQVAVKTGPGRAGRETVYIRENKKEAIVLDAKAKLTEWKINFDDPISEEEFVRALAYLKAEHGLTDEAAISMLETFVRVSDPEYTRTLRREKMISGGGLSYEQEPVKRSPSKGFGSR